MEAKYQPAGALGMLCLPTLYYDFSDETKFDMEMSRLLDYLERPKTRKTGLYVKSVNEHDSDHDEQLLIS